MEPEVVFTIAGALAACVIGGVLAQSIRTWLKLRKKLRKAREVQQEVYRYGYWQGTGTVDRGTVAVAHTTPAGAAAADAAPGADARAGARSGSVEIPLVAGPIVGYRSWSITPSGLLSSRMQEHFVWSPGIPFVALCAHGIHREPPGPWGSGCNCGI